MDSKSNKPNRRQALLASAGLVAGAFVSGPARAHASEDKRDHCDNRLPVSQLNAVFGVDGTPQPGGVLLFDLGRSDLQPMIFGVSVDPDWGFDTEITFQPLCEGAIVKFEMCLLDQEVNPVLEALIDAHLQPPVSTLNALHNHFLEINPEVKFLHGTAIGDPVKIARALYDALKNNSAQPFESSPPQDTELPNQQIAKIIGGTSMVSGKVLSVSVDRKDHFEEFEIQLESASQLESKFSFQRIGNNTAALDAEYVLRPSEMDAVVRTLRQQGFKITAVHNHELFIEPRLYYLHSFTTGDPLILAKAVRAGLEHGNFKLES